jgi:hypothetical protein
MSNANARWVQVSLLNELHFHFNLCMFPSKMMFHIINAWSICTLSLSQPYFERVWGWNSHSRNGDLGVFRDSQKFTVRLQRSKTSHWGVLYIIEKLLKCRCPKWDRMTHLDIYNTSYGQKKGRESNWQFDFQPWEVGGGATCHWKALDEG